jgi:hypothetical protein
MVPQKCGTTTAYSWKDGKNNMVDSSETTEMVDTQPKVNKTTDRLDQLEAMIAGLASAVEGLTSKLAAPQGMGRALSPEALLEGGVDDVRRRVIDLKYPGRAESGFQPDDIVTPKPGSKFEGMIRAGLKLDSDDPTPLGQIISYMYTTKREGESKYKVFFKGYGKNGCLESELEKVEL